MHAVGRLIYRYITKNKGRTLFIGFSIMISAAMIFFIQLSLRDIRVDKEIRYINARGGKYTCSVFTTNEDYMEYVKDIDIVKNISYCLATLNQFTINDGQINAELIGMSDNIDELVNFKLVNGEYPKNNNEIALEREVLADMENPPKVGDKIKLYNNKEDLELEYTLTGTFDYIFTNNSSKERGIAYITLDEAKSFLKEHLGKKEGQMTYEFLIETPNKIKEEEIVSKLNHPGATIDSKNLFYSNATYNENKKSENVINTMSFIMIVVAMLTLYNVFSSSIAIKTSEFGMIKAIGMRDSELRLMVIGEGIVIGIMSITIGMVIGKLGYDLMVDLLNIKYLNYGTRVIPCKEILLTYAFCIVGIILSVYVSSRKILKQSAIEEIKGNEYLDISDLKRQNEKEIGEIPKKLISDLVSCNIKRNKKTFKTTVTSIAVSIALLIAGIYNASNIYVDKKRIF